jgi:hypothetical protein
MLSFSNQRYSFMNKNKALTTLCLSFMLCILSQTGYSEGTLMQTVYFDPFASTPAPDSIAALKGTKDLLEEHPGYNLLIEGHADKREIKPGENDVSKAMGQLSKARADFVANWIKAALRGRDVTTVIRAYGAEQPAGKAFQKDRHAANRRVVLTVYSPDNPPAVLADMTKSGQGAPKVSVENAVYSFDGIFENEFVTHDFVVKNAGVAPLDILSVKPG